MLYLIATPIGNLKDITFRAIETLQACDFILCEDTRHSSKLLQHYKISTPLKSFHKFSEAKQEDKIIEELNAGKTIGLISDAGTPGISDPGTRLVQRCKKEGVSVIAIPGPCAAVTALSSSGLDTDLFQFVGFLPRKPNECKLQLVKILFYPGTTVCYESPNRILNILTVLEELAPNRLIAIGRELTKIHEESLLGTPKELLNHFKSKEIRGEFVLLISGETSSQWESMPPEKHVEFLETTYHLSKKDAVKFAAEMRGVPKKTLYHLNIN